MKLKFMGGVCVPLLLVVSAIGSVVLTNERDAKAAPYAATSDVEGFTNAASASGSVFVPLTPVRIMDTREGLGGSGTFNAGSIGNLTVAGVGGVDAAATAVVLNMTVTSGTTSSFLSAWPTGNAQPTASILNWSTGQTVPNMIAVALGSGGAISIYNLAGNVDVIADVAGYYVAGGSGPAGPTGATGATGSTGAAGSAGAAGSTGAAGSAGLGISRGNYSANAPFVGVGTSGSQGVASMTGSDGLPAFVFISASSALTFGRCSDLACSGFSTTTLNAAASSYPTIILGPLGAPIIAYNQGGLRLIYCLDLGCSPGLNVNTFVEVGTAVGPAVQLMTDGLLAIAFYRTTSGANDLRFIKCGDGSCGSPTTTDVETTGSIGAAPSIALGQDGFAVMSYHNVSADRLKVAKCSNLACTASVKTTVETVASGSSSSIAIGQDAMPIVSYLGDVARHLKVLKCGTSDCSGGNTITPLDISDANGAFSSITFAPDSMPIISYLSDAQDVRYAYCITISCSNAYYTQLRTGASSNAIGSSLTMGVDNLPLVMFSATLSGTIGFVHLSSTHGTLYARNR